MVGGIATPTAWNTLPQMPWLATNGELGVVFFDLRFLQGFEILLDIGPLENMAGFFQPTVQLLSKQQGQKAAKHMSPDGLIPLVEDGTCFKKDLHVPEDPFDLPQFLVLESNLGGRELGVGSEYPFAIEASFLFDFFQIDTDAPVFDLNVLAVTLVADKAFRTCLICSLSDSMMASRSAASF